MKKNIVKTLSVMLAAVLAGGLFAGCGNGTESINGSETGVVINGEGIPCGEVNLFLRYQQAQTYYYMQQLGMTTSAFWSSAYSYNIDENGMIVAETAETEESSESSDSSETQYETVDATYGEYFKASVLENLTSLVAIRQTAVNEYGIELTEEQTAAIEEAAQSFMEANEDVEETYGATQEMVEDILELYTYQSVLKPYVTEDIDREVSDEEASQTTILYVRMTKNSEGEEETAAGDEETKTNSELFADCEEVLDIIKDAGDITDDEANELADEVNESFFAMEYSMDTGDTETFPEEVNEALATLEDGEVYDGVIDTTNYYYIVKMIANFDEEATESHKDTIIAERETEAYSAAVNEWAAAAEVEIMSCVEKLSVNDNNVYSSFIPTSEESETDTTTDSESDTSTDSSSDTSEDSESTSVDSSADTSADSSSETKSE